MLINDILSWFVGRIVKTETGILGPLNPINKNCFLIRGNMWTSERGIKSSTSMLTNWPSFSKINNILCEYQNVYLFSF